MMRALILAIPIVGSMVSLSALAQEANPEPERSADFMLGIGSGQTNFSLAYQYAWRFGQKQKLRMGVGARFNGFSASDKYFVSAPAKIVKGESGPAALFKEPIKANMDSVQLSSAQVYSLNVLIHISYAFTDKLRAGFNIDVIGVSFGGSQPGTYINGNAPDAIFTKPVSASPSAFNLLLVGENDLGSLNSEFFATYSLNDKWALKGGVQHIFMEYTTDTQVQQFPEPNDRFRITPTVACFGVVYSFR
jgi:hypothetical protein